jgi:hypothetical protein
VIPWEVRGEKSRIKIGARQGNCFRQLDVSFLNSKLEIRKSKDLGARGAPFGKKDSLGIPLNFRISDFEFFASIPAPLGE